MRNTRLPGHGLLREGKPYVRRAGRYVPADPGVREGRGLCSCGARSEVVDSDGARKRWHREVHKPEVKCIEPRGTKGDVTVWHLWAHLHKGRLIDIGSRRYTEAHGDRDPMLPVDVCEVPADSDQGTHWGWMRTDTDTPAMIWPTRAAFEACFTCGPKVEQERGKGREVRLLVVPATLPIHPADAAALAGDQAALAGDMGRAVRKLLSEPPPGWAGRKGDEDA